MVANLCSRVTAAFLAVIFLTSTVYAQIPGNLDENATLFGCPVTAFAALETACPITEYPACATRLALKDYNAECCSSLETYGSSISSCYSKNAPDCLDTAAAATFLNGDPAATGLDPCAAFASATGSVTALTDSPISSIESKIGSKISSLTASRTATGSSTATPTGAGSVLSIDGWKLSLGLVLVAGFGTLRL